MKIKKKNDLAVEHNTEAGCCWNINDIFLRESPVTKALNLCLFNLYAEYIMRNAGLEEAQTGIKIAGRNINNLRYADDYHPYGRK